jgi:hypothetical protein
MWAAVQVFPIPIQGDNHNHNYYYVHLIFVSIIFSAGISKTTGKEDSRDEFVRKSGTRKEFIAYLRKTVIHLRYTFMDMAKTTIAP